jgi:hypothetical protein
VRKRKAASEKLNNDGSDRRNTVVHSREIFTGVLKTGLIKPPRLRTDAAEEREMHATWLELFYDLVFVAAISQLAGNLSRDYSLKGLLHFTVLFVPVWWAWIGQTFYLTRFNSDDIGHRLLTMA